MERKIAVMTLYAVLIFAAVYVFFKYILNLILPFVIAWIVVLMIQPVVTLICRNTHITRKIISVVLVLFVLITFGFIAFTISERLLYELKAIIDKLSYSTDEILDTVFDFVYIDHDLFKNALTSISAKIPEWIGKVFNTLPNAVFFTIILVMAAFYICADFNAINKFISMQLPKRVVDFLTEVKTHLKSTGLKYIRAYSLLIIITFFQLLIGLSILKIEYSFTIALITAALDVLPVIGVGTILIPWSVVLLISGDYYIGFGLLIIFCVVSLIRQLIEPKIVGRSIGLNPLVTLISMYAGYKIFGFAGMLAMPVCAIIIKNLNDSGTITLYRIK